MMEAFEAYNIKSHVIIDHKIHLEEGKDFRDALVDHLWNILRVDFNNETSILQFACKLSGNNDVKLS